MSYYFEDYSAQVMGYILSIPKDDFFTLQSLSEHTGISEDSLVPFIEQLITLGLICDTQPDKNYIQDYRCRISNIRKSELSQEKSVESKLPIAMSNAESEYADRVGGITSVMFELTYNCSEMCIHCYNLGATRNNTEISERGNRNEMLLTDYIKVIDELYNQGLVKVCLSGGDPFSKQDVWEIIEYLYEKDIAIDVYTNGQRLIGKTEKLAEYYPRLVGISIYSGIAEEHDYITRVKGSWDKSVQVISKLSDFAVPINIKCCVMKPNVNSYYSVSDIAKKYGAVMQFEIAVMDSISGDKCVSKYLRLSPDEYEIILRDSNIPLYVGKEAPNFGGQKRPSDSRACGAGYNSFCITPEGNIIPCCSFHLSFGNAKKQPVSEIMKSETLKWWQSVSIADYEECGKYDYCDYCNLCPGINHSEHGSPIKAGENNCYLAKIRQSLAIKMMNGYDPLNGKSLIEVIKSLKSVKNTLKREISR